MSELKVSGEQREPVGYIYGQSLIVRFIGWAGWILGWLSYLIAKTGLKESADALIDTAIVMRRANPGAVRAIGFLNGQRGLPAIRRGSLLVRGRTKETSAFGSLGFYATYHVAAPNKARALALIKRFEWDAIPETLEIEEGELEYPDTGAEGVLWIAPGRSFYAETD